MQKEIGGQNDTNISKKVNEENISSLPYEIMENILVQVCRDDDNVESDYSYGVKQQREVMREVCHHWRNIVSRPIFVKEVYKVWLHDVAGVKKCGKKIQQECGFQSTRCLHCGSEFENFVGFQQSNGCLQYYSEGKQYCSVTCEKEAGAYYDSSDENGEDNDDN
ncbi:uncharacterized protein LOC135489277 [Lineus longissimus]|uniref:uncharacterized protein LOC135489277 n=1 Tax=Lineus longissimus TaxID=88925 RepID=UPI002B4CFE0C